MVLVSKELQHQLIDHDHLQQLAPARHRDPPRLPTAARQRRQVVGGSPLAGLAPVVARDRAAPARG